MKNIIAIVVGLIIVLSQSLGAQNSSATSVSNRKIVFYGSLNHLHQDFFKKAFSYQGIETGYIFNHKTQLGAYASTFVSNLVTNVIDKPKYIYLAQSGIAIGRSENDLRQFHAGLQINIGYFMLIANDFNFPLFKTKNTAIKIEGWALTPQLYEEYDATKWLKLRLGLVYGFYSFKEQMRIKKTDLQHFGFSFGFYFGKFQ